MKDLRLFVKYSADAMPTVLLYDRIVMCFAMLLDNTTNIAELDSWFYDIDGFIKGYLMRKAAGTLGAADSFEDTD